MKLGRRSLLHMLAASLKLFTASSTGGWGPIDVPATWIWSACPYPPDTYGSVIRHATPWQKGIIIVLAVFPFRWPEDHAPCAPGDWGRMVKPGQRCKRRNAEMQ